MLHSAEWRRGSVGPITQRSVDRNHPSLVSAEAARQSHNLKVVSSILTRGKFLFIEGKYYIYKNQNFVISDHPCKQSGVEEACWAHNP